MTPRPSVPPVLAPEDASRAARPQMDVKHCAGCHNDFYNGNNPMGVTECWSLKTAKLIERKAVHIDQRPPWTQKAETYPSCYVLDRHIFVKPEVTR